MLHKFQGTAINGLTTHWLANFSPATALWSLSCSIGERHVYVAEVALASLLESQPPLISTKLAIICPVFSVPTFLIPLACVRFFSRYSSSRREAARGRPRRERDVFHQIARLGTRLAAPFRVRTLCPSPPPGLSHRHLCLRLLFSPRSSSTPPPPTPHPTVPSALRLTCSSPSFRAGLRRDGGGQEQVLHPVQHVLHLGHRGPVPLPGQDPRQEGAPGPGGATQHSRRHDQPDQRRYRPSQRLPLHPSGRRSATELAAFKV